MVTLHVGAGTFLPVKVEDTERPPHAQRDRHHRGRRPPSASTRRAARGGRIVAVGTTSLRLLETAADDGGRVRPFAGDTDIFITPGYRFKAVDLLLTNFHLPRSTLFMLVAAFAGLERMKAAYEHAKARGLSLLFLRRRVPARPRGGAPMSDVLAFAVLARAGAARRGRLDTAHGAVETPAFMPVGTAAHGQGDAAADRSRATGAAHRPRQHLSSDAAAGGGARRRARRPPRIHELAGARS